MKRRDFLVGSAATAIAASATSALALPAIGKPDHIAEFAKFIEKYAIKHSEYFGANADLFVKLNHEMLNRVPHVFINGYMERPMIIKGDRILVATARAFRTEYGYEYLNAVLSNPLASDFMVDVAATELAHELETQFKKTSDMVFYIPVELVKVVDPSTFEPRVGFKTRYGRPNLNIAFQAGTIDWVHNESA